MRLKQAAGAASFSKLSCSIILAAFLPVYNESARNEKTPRFIARLEFRTGDQMLKEEGEEFVCESGQTDCQLGLPKLLLS